MSLRKVFSVQLVVAEKVMVEKTAEEKVAIAKSTVENVAVEEVAAKTKRIRTRRRCSRMYQGTLDRQQLEEKRKHAGFLGGVSWQVVRRRDGRHRSSDC